MNQTNDSRILVTVLSPGIAPSHSHTNSRWAAAVPVFLPHPMSLHRASRSRCSVHICEGRKGSQGPHDCSQGPSSSLEPSVLQGRPPGPEALKRSLGSCGSCHCACSEVYAALGHSRAQRCCSGEGEAALLPRWVRAPQVWWAGAGTRRAVRSLSVREGWRDKLRTRKSCLCQQMSTRKP